MSNSFPLKLRMPTKLEPDISSGGPKKFSTDDPLCMMDLLHWLTGRIFVDLSRAMKTHWGEMVVTESGETFYLVFF